MTARAWLPLCLMAAAMAATTLLSISPACCPAPPSGRAVVNADQTVVILWDAESKVQHLIRQASFKSEADDFGFLVPTPAQPELEESGNKVFPYLAQITAPEIQFVSRPPSGLGCGCGSVPGAVKSAAPPPVRVLEQKQVAGFAAVVLEADSATALVEWLRENGFAYSPEVQAWAEPYVQQGWKITALKVAKDKSAPDDSQVSAAALRISFETERPLFPYREPDSKKSAATLGVQDRLLRIYFLGQARYEGELTKEQPWSGNVAWADKLDDASQQKILELLKLPASTAPGGWWLTEFEDHWPYQTAPADLYFGPSATQAIVKRPPIIQYGMMPAPSDITAFATPAFLVIALWWRRRKPTV